MGSVASLKLPQGFCFGTPNQTHDLLLPFLEVLAITSSTIFYSSSAPTATDESTINSIWVKTPENIAFNTLEMYFFTPKYAGATGPTWCKYYPYSVGDIELSNNSFLGEDETETARADKPNNRPFAACDGGTYGGFTTPNLTGKVLFGGICGTATNTESFGGTTKLDRQLKTTMRDAAPTATDADLATSATRMAVPQLKPLRLYVESGSSHTSAVSDDGVSPLVEPQTSLMNFIFNKSVPTNLQGARKVILKRDQVPNHFHRYGWETWQTKANACFGSGGNAAVATSVSSTTPTTDTFQTGLSTALTLGRPHDNLPPVYAGIYRMYIGYGT